MAGHQGKNRKYVKQPANWLTAELWEQYQAEPAPDMLASDASPLDTDVDDEGDGPLPPHLDDDPSPEID